MTASAFFGTLFSIRIHVTVARVFQKHFGRRFDLHKCRARFVGCESASISGAPIWHRCHAASCLHAQNLHTVHTLGFIPTDMECCRYLHTGSLNNYIHLLTRNGSQEFCITPIYCSGSLFQPGARIHTA